MYKDKSFNYCKIGYFINGELNGIGIQIPLSPLDKKKIPKDSVRYYKVGIWQNNDFVKGFHWGCNFTEQRSTFIIGGMKKDKKSGDAVQLSFQHCPSHYDNST